MRDPRTDPRPGDVLAMEHMGRITVVSRSWWRGIVALLRGGATMHIRLRSWRALMEIATVLHAAPDAPDEPRAS